VNRIGDFDFARVFLIVKHSTRSFHKVFDATKGCREADMERYVNLPVVLVGAAGKSHRSLYVWLPDAMAGPTPVSA